MKKFDLRSVREWLMTAPSFVWLAIFFAIPSVIIVLFTFHDHDALGGVGAWSMNTWRDLVDPDYPTIIWNTLRISFWVTVWSIVLAIPSAYAIARMREKYRAYVAGAIMLPFWTSFVVRVVAWKTLLHPDGWVQCCYNQFVRGWTWLFGASSAPASSTILDSDLAVIIVSVYTFLPFAIMPIYTAAEKFDYSLLEAARDLGAKNFYAFRKIFLPGIRQGIVSAVLMVFIPAIGSYVIPQIVGGTNCQLIGNMIYRRALTNRNIPHASALAVVMAVSVLVPFALAMWWKKMHDLKNRRRLETDTAHRIQEGREGEAS